MRTLTVLAVLGFGAEYASAARREGLQYPSDEYPPELPPEYFGEPPPPLSETATHARHAEVLQGPPDASARRAHLLGTDRIGKALRADSEMQFQPRNSADVANGKRVVRYEQMFRGIPVVDAGLAVRTDGGKVEQMHGVVLRGLQDDITEGDIAHKRYSADDAKRLAFEDAEVPAGQAEYAQVRLIIYLVKDTVARVAYEVMFEVHVGDDLSVPCRIIDANTGTVLARWDALPQGIEERKSRRKSCRRRRHHPEPKFMWTAQGPGGNLRIGRMYHGGPELRQMPVTRTGDVCSMETTETRIIHHLPNATSYPTFTFNCSEQTMGEVNGAYSTLNDAYAYMTYTLDMYREWTNSSAISYRIPVLVYDGLEYENAAFTPAGKYLMIGDGGNRFYPLSSLDVISHELAHAVTNENSGLYYFNQSGGLNEAFSDIAGEAAKYFVFGENDWRIGHSIEKHNLALRFFDDPTKDWRGIAHTRDYYANINPHYSSGPINRAFYLMGTQGGAWDVPNIFRVFLLANRVYWTKTSTYEQAICDVWNAASDLQFDSLPERTVMWQAFAAIGVPPCGNENPLLEANCTNTSVQVMGTEAGVSIPLQGDNACWSVSCPVDAPHGVIMFPSFNVQPGHALLAVGAEDTSVENGELMMLLSGNETSPVSFHGSTDLILAAKGPVQAGEAVVMCSKPVELTKQGNGLLDQGVDICDTPTPVTDSAYLNFTGYRNNYRACWKLACPSDGYIFIESFDLEYNFDNLYVNGKKVTNGTYPIPVASGQDTHIVFISDGSITTSGFTLFAFCGNKSVNMPALQSAIPDRKNPTYLPQNCTMVKPSLEQSVHVDGANNMTYKESLPNEPECFRVSCAPGYWTHVRVNEASDTLSIARRTFTNLTTGDEAYFDGDNQGQILAGSLGSAAHFEAEVSCVERGEPEPFPETCTKVETEIVVENYRNNMSMCWSVECGGNWTDEAILEFTEFELDLDKVSEPDYVTFNNTDKNFTGSSSPERYPLPQDGLTVYFRSNEVVVGKGFAATVMCRGPCVRLYNDSTIDHYFPDGAYDNDEDLCWWVTCPTNGTLTFTEFDTEIGYDYVFIGSKNFSGTDLPPPITFDDPIKVEFKSDAGVTAHGFTAEVDCE